jgi:sec-independent protein translocase protein TatA
MVLPAGMEWTILIAVVAGILIFGGKKIPQLARSFGRASGKYEKARMEVEEEISHLKSEATLFSNTKGGKLEEIDDTLGIDYSGKSDEQVRRAIEPKINKGGSN